MNRSLEQVVEVAFRYPVHFTRDLFSPRNALLRELLGEGAAVLPVKVLVVADGGLIDERPDLPDLIEAYCRDAEVLSLVRAPLLLEGGEGVKNEPAHVAAIHEEIHRYGLDRQSFVVAVGGGALLDMVGYAAATAHRGVRLVRVPTTVLSQNDSGVGVKNSVNAFGKKNFLGTFAPPYAVLNDSAFLETLSTRDWRSGASEAVKVALLKDPEFFAFLERNASALAERDLKAMEHLVFRCSELHLQHIATSGDPFEFGSSRPLDFGHWAAHKLEQLTAYRLRHGEAVAIGIALDASYSHLAGMLPEQDWARIVELLLALRLPVFDPTMVRHLTDRSDPRSLLAGLDEFREHLGGELTIMLLEGIGRGREVHWLDEAVTVDAIRLLERYAAEKGVAA